MEINNENIFKNYYTEDDFVDRYESQKEESVDVIIPLINTNELWEKDLCSFYREIPINRLLIGDGGCTDNSIEIARKFPRSVIVDQSDYHSQGYCIKELMAQVETKWFIYLHADVYLPGGWYDEMKKHQGEYDWFECYRRMTILYEYLEEAQNKAERPFSGSQMGRTEAFKNILPKIDDDYLQRNEDIIFGELIKAEGFKYGRVSNTFHYHQLMNKKGEKEPKLKKVAIQKETDVEWEIKISEMQIKGIIKYLQPKKYLIKSVNAHIAILLKYNALDWSEFKKWVKQVNPAWSDKISRSLYRKPAAIAKIKALIKFFSINRKGSG